MQMALAFILLLSWHLLAKVILKNRLLQGLYLFSFNNELSELEREVVAQSYLGLRCGI